MTQTTYDEHFTKHLSRFVWISTPPSLVSSPSKPVANLDNIYYAYIPCLPSNIPFRNTMNYPYTFQLSVWKTQNTNKRELVGRTPTGRHDTKQTNDSTLGAQTSIVQVVKVNWAILGSSPSPAGGLFSVFLMRSRSSQRSQSVVGFKPWPHSVTRSQGTCGSNKYYVYWTHRFQQVWKHDCLLESRCLHKNLLIKKTLDSDSARSRPKTPWVAK